MVYRSSRIKLSAGQIFWREAGDYGCPIAIFLHGSWHDNSQWEDSIDLLSKNFHCFALDLVGFGNSIVTQTPDSIELEVDCLHDFLTALKLDRVYLVGHSLGAWIAMSYALKYPDFVRGVVVISPEGFSLPSWKQYGRMTTLLLSQPWLFKLWLKGLEVIVSIGDNADPLAKSQAYWTCFNKFPTTCKLLFQRSSQEIRQELVVDNLSKFRPPLLVLQSDIAAQSVIDIIQTCVRAVRKSEFKLITVSDSSSSQELTIQATKEIQLFLDRIQVQIDREEVELW
jgi:pimeloyl-ACP methyl ester carboxylesterase